MSARKPLHPSCIGGVWCPVEGHVTVRHLGNGRRIVSHIRLTTGQWKTLRERRSVAS